MQAYITQPVAIRTGSLRRKNKSACAGAVRNSYEAYDERTVPAHRKYVICRFKFNLQ